MGKKLYVGNLPFSSTEDDIRSFFDEIDHGWMLRFLEHRIADQRIIRLTRKWLEAGVIEDGKRIPAQRGTPQGAVASPLLANIYLHYAFDLWVRHWRKQPGRGEVIVLRYADDSVVGFEKEGTARGFLADLRERLTRFGLSLHPDKTRLIEIGRYAAERRRKRGQGRPDRFDFLGFTQCCGTLLWDQPTREVPGCATDGQEAYASDGDRDPRQALPATA